MTVAENKRRIHDEFDWFDAHRTEIIEGHQGEWAAVRDHKVWGYFPTRNAGRAFMEGSMGIEFGDYALQMCQTQEEELERNFIGISIPGGRNVQTRV
jgi:hypothetical protein